MARKGQHNAITPSEDAVHSGTESWNIAQYFTGFAIAVPLRELNELELVARYGSVKLDEEVALSDDLVDKRRAEAIKRYQTVLHQIISDTFFKVKKGDLITATNIMEHVEEQAKYFDRLLILKTDNISHNDKIKINEELLTLLLNRLKKKKFEYLAILDRTGLIFKESDDFSIEDIMKDFVEGG